MDAQITSWLKDEHGSLTRLGRWDADLNLLFTAAFTGELIFNAFSNWFSRFAHNGWNVLDFSIVCMSLVDLGIANIPDWLVKLMRAFRVIRLFGRVQARGRDSMQHERQTVSFHHDHHITRIIFRVRPASAPHLN